MNESHAPISGSVGVVDICGDGSMYLAVRSMRMRMRACIDVLPVASLITKPYSPFRIRGYL